MEGSEVLEKDLAMAVQWFEKAATIGLSAAQNVLGNCYKLGVGVMVDKTLSETWFKKAVDQGDFNTV